MLRQKVYTKIFYDDYLLNLHYDEPFNGDIFYAAASIN